MLTSRAVADGIRAPAMPYVFSAANDPAAVGAALGSLRILRSEPERMQRLREVDRFHGGITDVSRVLARHRLVSGTLLANFWRRGRSCLDGLAAGLPRSPGRGVS